MAVVVPRFTHDEDVLPQKINTENLTHFKAWVLNLWVISHKSGKAEFQVEKSVINWLLIGYLVKIIY